MGYSQVYTIDCKTDSLVKHILSIENTKELLRGDLMYADEVIRYKDSVIEASYDTINQLNWYKKYYMKSKELLSPRIIARIEDEAKTY